MLVNKTKSFDIIFLNHGIESDLLEASMTKWDVNNSAEFKAIKDRLLG